MNKLLLALLAVLLAVSAAWGQSCNTVRTNHKGTAGAGITVSSTAVVVAEANASRCSLFIDNVSSNDMRCRSARDGDPTTTAGKLIASGESWGADAAKEQWKCIRTGGSDATAEVQEELP